MVLIHYIIAPKCGCICYQICYIHDKTQGTYYCFQCNLYDYTGNQWVTFFQESAEKILGRSAQELGDLKDTVSHQPVNTASDVHVLTADWSV